MLVEEYIQIAKEEFPYLFNEYGFKVVHTYQGEGRDRGRYAFGIESDLYKMRIFFSRQVASGIIYFGPSSALFFDQHFEWVDIANLLWYLNRQKIDWSEVLRYQEEDSIRPDFRLQSRLLKPHCPKIFEMFSSPEAIAAWKPQHDEFIHKAFLENPRYHPKKARAGRK